MEKSINWFLKVRFGNKNDSWKNKIQFKQQVFLTSFWYYSVQILKDIRILIYQLNQKMIVNNVRMISEVGKNPSWR